MATQHLEHSGVSWKGQQLGHKHSRIDTLDPRLRIIFTMIFAVVTVFSQSFPSLLAALSFALLSALFARLDYKRTVRRVVAMDLFIIFMLILLPFTTPGDALINIGPLQATQQGLLLALAIGLKANAIILMTPRPRHWSQSQCHHSDDPGTDWHAECHHLRTCIIQTENTG